jgi:hypothetical protein
VWMITGRVKDRPVMLLKDLPPREHRVELCWWKRWLPCAQPLCGFKTCAGLARSIC